jgi:hypothetical protein
MGEFSYSAVKAKLTPELLEADLKRLNTELFEDKYKVERVEGVPISRADDRKTKWCFTFTNPPPGFTDASFSVTLLRDGRMEFKVPRSQWDEHWEAQQKIRRRLVRLYNQ